MTTPILEPQVNADQSTEILSHGAQLAAALDGPPPSEDEVSQDQATKPEETPSAVETPAVAPPVPEDEVQELRQIVRSLMRQNADLKSHFQRIRTEQTAAAQQPKVAPKTRDPLDEVFGIKDEAAETPQAPPAKAAEIPPTRYEELQNALGYVGATKGPLLDTLVATMEMNPQYQDVRAVCSRDNLDSLVEQAAKRYVASNPGTDFVEATMEIELAIWSQSNPYKYMYDAIKATNPRFVVPGTEPVVTKSPAQERATSGPQPAVAPTSIIPLGGSDADRHGGWTAEKIDSLDDEAYAKLPEDIRMKYLAGDFNVK